MLIYCNKTNGFSFSGPTINSLVTIVFNAARKAPNKVIAIAYLLYSICASPPLKVYTSTPMMMMPTKNKIRYKYSI